MRLAPALLILLALPAMAGTLYRWTDAQGKVHFSDQPPPGNIKNSVEKQYGKKEVEEQDPLAQAQERFPLVLYTTNSCGNPCELAKAHLAKRGAPYASKDPATEMAANEALRADGASPAVPTLMVGTQKLEGYSSVAWDMALDVAGYPKAPAPTPTPAATEKP